jgi:hypothetical protein
MKNRILFFYTISLLVLFRGLFASFNLDFVSKFLSEALIILWLFLESKNTKFIFSKTILLYGVLYLFWTVLVTILFSDNLYEYYLYTRYFMLSFMMMYISYNIYDFKQYTRFTLKAIDLFVLLQIIASVLLFFTLGRLERNVGTMSTSGGSLATVWPLTFAPYYFLRFVIKGQWKDILFLAGIVFIGFASGKRAVYFLIPVSLIIIYYGFLGAKIFMKKKVIRRRLLFSVSFLFFVLLLGVSGTESLAQGNGFSLESLTSAFNYVGEYSNKENVMNGESIGRTSATKSTFNALWSDSNYLFGNGVTTLKGEITYSRYNVGYGVTGLIRELISVGLIGGIMYLLFYMKLFVMMRKGKHYMLGLAFDKEVFWIWILGISGLISILITIVGYSRVFSQSLNPIIFVLISVGLSLRAINEHMSIKRSIKKEKNS